MKDKNNRRNIWLIVILVIGVLFGTSCTTIEDELYCYKCADGTDCTTKKCGIEETYANGNTCTWYPCFNACNALYYDEFGRATGSTCVLFGFDCYTCGPYRKQKPKTIDNVLPIETTNVTLTQGDNYYIRNVKYIVSGGGQTAESEASLEDAVDILSSRLLGGLNLVSEFYCQVLWDIEFDKAYEEVHAEFHIKEDFYGGAFGGGVNSATYNSQVVNVEKGITQFKVSFTESSLYINWAYEYGMKLLCNEKWYKLKESA